MQVSEVYKLMKSWEADPCWDLENDANYKPELEPYRQILLDFAKEKRTEWAKREEAREKEIAGKICPFSTRRFCYNINCALWDKLGECCCFKSFNGVVKI